MFLNEIGFVKFNEVFTLKANFGVKHNANFSQLNVKASFYHF